MKSRYLSNGEKKDVEQAALFVLRPQHPGCTIVIAVLDETDERGVPQYTYTVTPNEEAASPGRV
jgi:hypothetical protein